MTSGTTRREVKMADIFKKRLEKCSRLMKAGELEI